MIKRLDTVGSHMEFFVIYLNAIDYKIFEKLSQISHKGITLSEQRLRVWEWEYIFFTDEVKKSHDTYTNIHHDWFGRRLIPIFVGCGEKLLLWSLFKGPISGSSQSARMVAITEYLQGVGYRMTEFQKWMNKWIVFDRFCFCPLKRQQSSKTLCSGLWDLDNAIN